MIAPALLMPDISVLPMESPQRIILAPMEGLTDPPMRRLLTDIGRYDWCVSEFIRVTDQLLPPHVIYGAVPELYHGGCTASQTPVHVQFLGHDAHVLADNAAQAAQLGAPAIDLNFGCPAKTVNRHRGGAVLLDEPEHIYNIVYAVRQSVPAHIPVSAKIRLGYLTDAPLLDNAHAVCQAGAQWLTIHARTKADAYRPPAYWDKILPVVQQLPNLTVIANGEIWTPQDAQTCMTASGCQDIMLGRGAVTRPDLVRRLRGQSALSWAALLRYQLAFLQIESKTDAGLIGRYKQWLGMLTAGYPEAQTLWQTAKKAQRLDELQQLLGAQLAFVGI